jgi:hypothetical protein
MYFKNIYQIINILLKFVAMPLLPPVRFSGRGPARYGGGRLDLCDQLGQSAGHRYLLMKQVEGRLP